MPDDYDDDTPRRRRDFDDAPAGRRRDRDDDDDRPPPRRKSGSKTLVIVLCSVFGGLLLCGGLAFVALFLSVGRVREAADRMKGTNNLKQVGLAASNFNDVNDRLPANTCSADGKPLLSWRVHLLPYLEQDNLYKKFKLDEPWDSQHNKVLLDQMPPVYVSPTAAPSTRLTHYRGFSSPGAVFEKKVVEGRPPGPFDQRLTLGRFADGAANTLLVVEAADPVEWTKPDDLDAGPGKPFPRLGTTKDYFLVLLADGSAKPLRQSLDEPTLRALVTYAGGEALPAGWDVR